MDKKIDVVEEVEEISKDLHDVIEKQGRPVFRRYPLIFGLLGTFGIVSVIYGFEGVIDNIPYLKEHPVILLLLGVVILLVTGGLYKRLRM